MWKSLGDLPVGTLGTVASEVRRMAAWEKSTVVHNEFKNVQSYRRCSLQSFTMNLIFGILRLSENYAGSGAHEHPNIIPIWSQMS